MSLKTSNAAMILKRKTFNCFKISNGQIHNYSTVFTMEKALHIHLILETIFKFLDLYNLKKTRLVCKFWNHVAQVPLWKRTVLYLELISTRTFNISTSLNKKSALAQRPGVSLSLYYSGSWKKIDQLLCLPALSIKLVLTKFNNKNIPMELSLRLISQFCLTLEELEIHPYGWTERKPSNVSLTVQDYFPKLRYIFVNCSSYTVTDSKFSEIVIRIVNSCLNLETYKSFCLNHLLGSKMLNGIKISRVKNLILFGYKRFCCSRENVILLTKTMFTQLKYLKFGLNVSTNDEENDSVSEYVLMSLLNQPSRFRQLNNLDISGIKQPERIKQFPICPSVKILTIYEFTCRTMELLKCFPILQSLNICRYDVRALQSFNLQGVKFASITCLKICNSSLCVLPAGYSIKFLELFPSVNTLNLDAMFLLQCCIFKTALSHKFTNVLEHVEHIIIRKPRYAIQSDISFCEGIRFLAALSGLKTIRVASVLQAVHLPVEDMPGLNSISFPWQESQWECSFVARSAIEKLGKCGVTLFIQNCCRIRRNKDAKTKKDLQKVFEMFPLATCGCNFNMIDVTSQIICNNC